MKHKIIRIIVMLVVILTVFCNCNVQAIEDPLKNPNSYNGVTQGSKDTALITMGGKVLGIINTIGVVASVIILMIIGIKYMLGSVEEKAGFKESMMGYVIGTIMVFGITTIANIIYTVGTKLF